MKTAASAQTVDSLSTPATTELPISKKTAPATSIAGFLLMDCSLNLLWFNAEAVRILSYPRRVENPVDVQALVAEKIRSRLIVQPSAGVSAFAPEFTSGMRRYFCRAFSIDPQAKEDLRPCIAVLLERGPSGLFRLSQVSERFNLTVRERHVLEYLLQGMTTKEIADRMRVTPSTVKSFLRMIMIKTRASSRSAILARIMMS